MVLGSVSLSLLEAFGSRCRTLIYLSDVQLGLHVGPLTIGVEAVSDCVVWFNFSGKGAA